MTNLNALLLEWTSSSGDSSKEELETLVLNMLKPHQQLKELTVRGYGGTRFPNWLGDFSFSSLVILRFEDCGKCTSLPSVGQLPLLKELVIKGMCGVKILGPEFYGNGFSVPFSSLEALCFEAMEEWKSWITHGPGQEVIGFPRLQVLSIVRCSQLQGNLPEDLPSLKRLVIKRCEQLLVSVPSLPTLCTLEIDECKEVVWRSTLDLSSLNTVVLSGIASQLFLSERFLHVLPKLEDLKIVACQELTSFWQSGIELLQDVRYLRQLVIEQCPQLLSLVGQEGEEQQQRGLPCRLQYLELRDCESLVKLPQLMHSLSSLREISIKECPRLVSFPEAALPSQLRFISIFKCNALKSLPEAWMHSSNKSLESLSIGFCSSLTTIASVHLPSNLKRLVIHGCNNLQTLIDEEDVSIMCGKDINSANSRSSTYFLEYLEIKHCPSLTSLWSKSELPATLQQIEIFHCPRLASLSSRGNLPKALKRLFVDRCPKMESFAESVINTCLESIKICDCENFKFLPYDLNKLGHFQKISILDCPNFVSFPAEGVPSTKLSELSIIGCEKLEALPNFMHNLNTLQHLAVTYCPAIVSFPEDGFPTNLQSLEIKDLSICKSLFLWGLHRLTALRRLHISGGCPDMFSFPDEEIGMKLPTSLIQLQIENIPNLECLSSTVRNLTSLEELELYSCPKLESFPRAGLPPSLLRLYIDGCPLLQKRCRKDKGQYWLILAHIPYVFTDWRWVFDRRKGPILFNFINDSS